MIGSIGAAVAAVVGALGGAIGGLVYMVARRTSVTCEEAALALAVAGDQLAAAVVSGDELAVSMTLAQWSEVRDNYLQINR